MRSFGMFACTQRVLLQSSKTVLLLEPRMKNLREGTAIREVY